MFTPVMRPPGTPAGGDTPPSPGGGGMLPIPSDASDPTQTGGAPGGASGGDGGVVAAAIRANVAKLTPAERMALGRAITPPISAILRKVLPPEAADLIDLADRVPSPGAMPSSGGGMPPRPPMPPQAAAGAPPAMPGGGASALGRQRFGG